MQNIPAVLSDEEHAIVRVGLAAATLLSDGNFADVIKAVMVDAFTAITESTPAQIELRDNSYHLIRGLKAIEAELETRVQAKDAIERRMDAENATDADPLIDDAELGITE